MDQSKLLIAIRDSGPGEAGDHYSVLLTETKQNAIVCNYQCSNISATICELPQEMRLGVNLSRS